MILQEFENTWLGKPIDFDGWFGDQCVDLMNQYLKDVCGIQNPIQSFPGATAYEIYQNANNPQFDKIDNTPTGVPQPGDIVFWQPNVSGVTGSAGHVALFLRGDANSFTSLDQNYPTNTLVHEQTHTYAGIAGWLHFKGQASNTYKGIDLTNIESVKVCVDTWYALTQGQYVPLDEVNAICTTLGIPTGSGRDAILATITQLQKDKAQDDQTVSLLNSQLPALKTENESLKGKIDNLTVQLTDPVSNLAYKELYAQAEGNLTETKKLLAASEETNNRQMGQYQNTSVYLLPKQKILKVFLQRLLHLQ